MWTLCRQTKGLFEPNLYLESIILAPLLWRWRTVGTLSWASSGGGDGMGELHTRGNGMKSPKPRSQYPDPGHPGGPFTMHNHQIPAWSG